MSHCSLLPSDLHRRVEVSPRCRPSMHQLRDAPQLSDEDRSVEVSRDAAPQCINSAMDHGRPIHLFD